MDHGHSILGVTWNGFTRLDAMQVQDGVVLVTHSGLVSSGSSQFLSLNFDPIASSFNPPISVLLENDHPLTPMTYGT
jgi:hypothetical protein